MIPYIASALSLTLVIDNRPYAIPKTHPNFAAIVDLVKKPTTEKNDILPLLDIPRAISKFTDGEVTVVNGKLYFKGFEVKNSLSKKILEFVNSGDETAADPLKQFLIKAQNNPDPRAASDLYDWVVAAGLPIAGDGDILAWKAVGKDYLSHHSGPRGKLDHSIGNVVSEPRHETNPDPRVTCSRGIHFCGPSYIKGWYNDSNSRIVAVKINPTNVVSFPKDYDTKGRCCELLVVGEVGYDAFDNHYEGNKTVDRRYDKVVPKKVAPRTANGKFAVGQIWETRAGRQLKVTSITNSGFYKIITEFGASYTEEGHYMVRGGGDSPADLVKLITDVA